VAGALARDRVGGLRRGGNGTGGGELRGGGTGSGGGAVGGNGGGAGGGSLLRGQPPSAATTGRGFKLVHVEAQLEPFLALNPPYMSFRKCSVKPKSGSM